MSDHKEIPQVPFFEKLMMTQRDQLLEIKWRDMQDVCLLSIAHDDWMV
jgi:hypothetical protein